MVAVPLNSIVLTPYTLTLLNAGPIMNVCTSYARGYACIGGRYSSLDPFTLCSDRSMLVRATALQCCLSLDPLLRCTTGATSLNITTYTIVHVVVGYYVHVILVVYPNSNPCWERWACKLCSLLDV